jgi:hypothetical protein
MLHVVDVGHALAYTVDGEQWRARMRSREGRLWPVGGWDETARTFSPGDSAALMEAVSSRPPLPFPQTDHVELWLLNKTSRRPLALLQTRNSAPVAESAIDAVWWPFLVGDTDFHAECLRGRNAARSGLAWPAPHRDVLARQVNDAARPYSLAQWFVRTPDGRGKGLKGSHLPADLRGRILNKEAFPELLVEESWSDPAAGALVREYHDWNAAALLTHLDLTADTRRRLETAACRRPEKLLEVFRLIPEFVDRAKLDIALVQARLMLTHAVVDA